VVTCSPDGLDGLVDLEHLGDRNTAVLVEIVPFQANIGGGNRIRNDRNVVTAAVTKNNGR
jgi:hypothetical protein